MRKMGCLFIFGATAFMVSGLAWGQAQSRVAGGQAGNAEDDGSWMLLSIPHVRPTPTPAADMAAIPAGSFAMGNATNVFPASEGHQDELPQHAVQVRTFYIARCEVTKAQWDVVYNWALTNGYHFDHPGSGKAAIHPVHTVSWYDVVKWCNARSQKEGLTPCYYTSADQATVFKTGTNNLANDCVKWTAHGYRLPTEAEWEKAARGGVADLRFPWVNFTNNIAHAKANYYGSHGLYSYDLSIGYHPSFTNGAAPYTGQVGSFAPNGYGLYDAIGNVQEWCWDWFDAAYYGSSPALDPRGPAETSGRTYRGGAWMNISSLCRVAERAYYTPNSANMYIGFRVVQHPGW